jgi:hypothetical protein
MTTSAALADASNLTRESARGGSLRPETAAPFRRVVNCASTNQPSDRLADHANLGDPLSIYVTGCRGSIRLYAWVSNTGRRAQLRRRSDSAMGLWACREASFTSGQRARPEAQSDKTSNTSPLVP